MNEAALDPELARYFRALAEAGRRSPSKGTVDQARAAMAARAAAAPPGRELPVVDVELPVDGGHVPLRVYEPAVARATIVYLHGGGWVMGDLATTDRLARELAHVARARVVSVGYRLAPEFPFPHGLEDSWLAVRWASHEFPDEPLVLAGDSAGGNLAAVCAHRALRRGGPEIALQALIYPAVDCDQDRDSYLRATDESQLLTAADMAWFWDHYVPEPHARTAPEVSPLLLESHAGLPPALVVVAGHDPLRDEGLEYAQRLRQSGVATSVLELPAMAHGFIGLLGIVDEAAQTLAQIGRELDTRLAGA